MSNPFYNKNKYTVSKPSVLWPLFCFMFFLINFTPISWIGMVVFRRPDTGHINWLSWRHDHVWIHLTNTCSSSSPSKLKHAGFFYYENLKGFLKINLIICFILFSMLVLSSKKTCFIYNDENTIIKWNVLKNGDTIN